MIKHMLDTNICIYLIRQRPAQVIERLQRARISELGISAITLSELEYGVSKSRRPEQNKIALAEFLAPLEVVPYDDTAAQQYGHVRAYLEGRGRSIGSLDLLIAAHALSVRCILVTNNEREFSRVPDLQTENWATG